MFLRRAFPHAWLRCAQLLLLSACCAHGALHAAELNPEQRLQAIRQALVEAAMKSNTRVSATSWMDSTGALRELNRFSSEIKVRDLQVTRYGRDEAQEPEAEILAVSTQAVEPTRCTAPQAKSALMHVMSFGLDLSPSLTATQRYIAQQVGLTARQRVLQAATQAQHWRVMTDPVYTRTYERLTYSHGEEKVQWHMQLTVAPAPLGLSTDDSAAFVLLWQVQAPGQLHAMHSSQDVLLGAPIPASATTPKLDSEMRQAIDQAVARMGLALDIQLSCEPPSIEVTQGDSGRLTVNAGGRAGLRVGDKLMLSDARVLPKHALEAGALDAAVLVEVRTVSLYQAELKQVAGRAQKFQGAWVAWPYTY